MADDYVDLSRVASKIANPTKLIVPELRFGTITAVDTSTNPQTVSVRLSGEATAIVGVPFLGDLRPVANSNAVLIKNGADLFVIGSTDSQNPPAGSIVAYAGSVAPSGWLLCDGGSYTRTTYAGLFAAIGTTYGAPSGTTFRVPDLAGRVPIGTGTGLSGLTVRSLASIGGSENVTLTTSQIPSHAHHITKVRYTDSTSHHHTTGTSGYVAEGPSFSGNNGISAAGGDTDNAGSDGSHTNMPPWLALSFYIKT